MDGLTAEALGHLEKALECDPNHAPALIALGDVYLSKREFTKLDTLLKEALAIRQDQPEVFFLQARFLHLQKEYDCASAAIERAIKLDELQSEYFHLAAEIAEGRERPNERQFFLERLIDLEPLEGNAHYELAKLLHHPDDFERVKLLLEISIDLLPRDARPLLSLAQHLYAGEKSLADGTVSIESDPCHAKQLLGKLLSIDPKDSPSKLLLAQIELENNSTKVAEALYMEAFGDKKTKGEAAYRLGLIWEEKGNAKNAVKFYKAAMETDEWIALGEFRLGLLLLEEGKRKQAEKHFKQCLSALEEKAVALTKSKELHLDKLRFHESRKELESLQAIRKFTGEAYFGIYKCNHDSRLDEKVNRYLDKAIALYPHYPEANYEKGLFFLVNQDTENAKARFVKAVEHDWNHWASHMELGKIAKDNGDTQKADMHFKIVLDLDPKNKVAKKLLKQLQKVSSG